MQKLHFKNLNGIRAMAALIVVHSHLPVGYQFANKYIQSIYGFLKNGELGVYIFFLLSGFLITRIIIAEDKKFSIKIFYLKRIYRIWPLYYLCFSINLLIVFPFLNENGQYNHYNFYQYFFFLQNFNTYDIAVKKLSLIAPITINWSVSIEEQFYLLWPLIFLLIKSRFFKIFFIIIIMCISLYITQNIEAITGYSYFTTYSAVWELGFGGLMAFGHFQLKGRLIEFPKWLTFLAYVILISYFCNLIRFEVDYLTKRIINTFFIAFFIFEQCTNKNNIFSMDKIPLFHYIGKISYGIYLLHPLCFLALDVILVGIFNYGTTRNILIIAIGLPFIYLTATISYKYYESYFLKFKNKLA